MLTLVTGNANYSSWSFRAWLFLRESGLAFDEVRIAMFTPGWKEAVREHSPAGQVPVLLDGGERIWDSLAIVETVLERYPSEVGWPDARGARAHARSLVAEMHAGFPALRDELPVNVRARARGPRTLSVDCRAEVARIDEIFSECLARYRGPWLFGAFTVADVAFAPVVTRFRTYGVEVSEQAAVYCARLLARPSVAEWTERARREPERIAQFDAYLG